MEMAFCGDNIRLRLRGISDEDISPGFVLTSPQRPIKTVTAFKADLSIIETKNIICSGYSCVLHVHTLAEEVTLTVSSPLVFTSEVLEYETHRVVQSLLHYYDKKTRRKSKRPPQFAKVGMIVSALIETTAPICIERWEDYKMLGRFTLRDEGEPGLSSPFAFLVAEYPDPVARQDGGYWKSHKIDRKGGRYARCCWSQSRRNGVRCIRIAHDI